jgi:hypothetical protein
MEKFPEPTRIEIRIDEPRAARGSVDSQSVRVKVSWREASQDPPIIAALSELPDPVDVEVLRRADGGIEVVPKIWRTVRLGQEGRSFFELARREPGGLGSVPQIARASSFATALIEHYLPDFDKYAPGERAEYLTRTIAQVNEVAKSIAKLEKHLQYAAPGGRKAVAPIKDPERDVHAAVLEDVCGLTTLQIGKELGIPLPASDAMSGRRENQTVRRMIKDNGRPLLERRFGPEGWCAKVGSMRATRESWASMEPNQQFYTLLAEKRGTSAEAEKEAAVQDGFDKKLDEWMDAWERNERQRATSIQLSDPRFGEALARL